MVNNARFGPYSSTKLTNFTDQSLTTLVQVV